MSRIKQDDSDLDEGSVYSEKYDSVSGSEEEEELSSGDESDSSLDSEGERELAAPVVSLESTGPDFYYFQMMDGVRVALIEVGHLPSLDQGQVVQDFEDLIDKVRASSRIQAVDSSHELECGGRLTAMDFDQCFQYQKDATDDITDWRFPDIDGLRKLIVGALKQGHFAIFSQNLDVSFIYRCLEQVMQNASVEQKAIYEANKSKITIIGGKMVENKMSHLTLWALMNERIPAELVFFDDQRDICAAFQNLQETLRVFDERLGKDLNATNYSHPGALFGDLYRISRAKLLELFKTPDVKAIRDRLYAETSAVGQVVTHGVPYYDPPFFWGPLHKEAETRLAAKSRADQSPSGGIDYATAAPAASAAAGRV